MGKLQIINSRNKGCDFMSSQSPSSSRSSSPSQTSIREISHDTYTTFLEGRFVKNCSRDKLRQLLITFDNEDKKHINRYGDICTCLMCQAYIFRTTYCSDIELLKQCANILKIH